MWLRLTRKSDLALRLLRMLGDGQRRTGALLADRVGTTPGYLPQVMAPLVHAGWVVSRGGPRGGYRLTVPLASLSVLDVVEQIEGPMLLEGCCPMGHANHGDGPPCELHEVWASLHAVLREQLGRVALDASAAPHADTRMSSSPGIRSGLPEGADT